MTSATATASPSSTEENFQRPPLAVLEEQALDVAVYQPGDPTACGLPAISAPDDTQTVVRVFFACEPTNAPEISAIPARLVAVPPGSDAKRTALAALLMGPTNEEVNAGYRSAFGPASQDVSFDIEVVDSGLAVVNFDAAILNVPRIFVADADAIQIVTTLGQFSDVKRVTILVDRKFLCQVVEAC